MFGGRDGMEWNDLNFRCLVENEVGMWDAVIPVDKYSSNIRKDPVPLNVGCSHPSRWCCPG
jgi:hypothetical protein